MKRRMTGTSVAEEQAAIRLGTFSTRLRAMKIAMQEGLIRTFERLEPVLTRIVTQFQKWMDQLSPSDIQAFADALSGVANTIGWAAEQVARVYRLGVLFKDTVAFGRDAERLQGQGSYGPHALREAWTGELTVKTEKGLAAEITQRATRRSQYKFLMGVNMEPAG